MKQSLIISATGHFQVKLFAIEKITISLGKLKAFEFSTFMTANTYQTYYKFPESEIQGLLNLGILGILFICHTITIIT